MLVFVIIYYTFLTFADNLLQLIFCKFKNNFQKILEELYLFNKKCYFCQVS